MNLILKLVVRESLEYKFILTLPFLVIFLLFMLNIFVQNTRFSEKAAVQMQTHTLCNLQQINSYSILLHLVYTVKRQHLLLFIHTNIATWSKLDILTFAFFLFHLFMLNIFIFKIVSLKKISNANAQLKVFVIYNKLKVALAYLQCKHLQCILTSYKYQNMAKYLPEMQIWIKPCCQRILLEYMCILSFIYWFIYSALWKFSYPFIFFTFCYVAALC